MLNAAIVGLGRWGRHLVESLHGSERIRFVAGVEPARERAEPFARQHGITLLDDYAGVLADRSIDAVVIAHTNSLHVEYTVRAARAGKHVFVEKPLALSAAHALEAVHACREANVMLQVGFTWRFHPALLALGQWIDRGMLGTLLHVEGNYSGPSGYRHPPGYWRLSRAENPAGGMAARGIHIVDAMIRTCGRIESAYALSRRRVLDAEIDDTTSMLFEFADGMTGTLTTLMATAEQWRLQVFGAKGWARMECIEHLPQSTFATCGIDGDHTLVSYVAPNTERAELEAFAAAVRAAPYPTAAVDDAVHGLAVWEAISSSAGSGRRVAVGG